MDAGMVGYAALAGMAVIVIQLACLYWLDWRKQGKEFMGDDRY